MQRVPKSILLGLLLVLVAALPAVAQGQGAGGRGGGPPRGGGGRQMMGLGMYLERAWTLCSFDLGCSTTQLAKLKPTFASALKARDASLKAAAAKRDMNAASAALTKCKSTLDAKLKAVLSKAQFAKLQQSVQPAWGRSRPGAGPRAGAKGRK